MSSFNDWWDSRFAQLGIHERLVAQEAWNAGFAEQHYVEEFKVQLLDTRAQAPERNNPTDAGLDLYAIEETKIGVGKQALISTGIAISIPDGYVAFIKPRSGYAVKYGIDVMAGVIDSSYRGEIRVALINHGSEAFSLYEGNRIAQLVIQKVELWNPVVVDELDDTARGDKGFGSSGS